MTTPDLVAEARRFINYDRSTRMSKGTKSNRVSLVERLADEVERLRDEEWNECHVCRKPVHELYDLDGTDDGTKPLCLCCHDEHTKEIERLHQAVRVARVLIPNDSEAFRTLSAALEETDDTKEPTKGE